MVVALKVFKKISPNGNLTVYLTKRDFIDHVNHVDPVDGVIMVEDSYLRGRKVFGRIIMTYRYGRKEDEVMGVKFSKDLIIASEQIVPRLNEKSEITQTQEKLVKKIGENVYPFTLTFPNLSPCSVTLQQGTDDRDEPLGVEYQLKVYVAENEDDRTHKRSTVSMVVRKLQYAPILKGKRLPSSLVSKGFTFSSGKVSLEVTLDKEVYYHGENIGAHVVIVNASSKYVRNIKAFIVQHCEVTMVNLQFSKYISHMETRDGCPITPGASFTKVIYLLPAAACNRDVRNLALDGYLRDEEVNLASSTLAAEDLTDAIGIVVSYSFRVKLNCGALGGELTTDVPFKLMHPSPRSIDKEKVSAMKKMKSIERARYEANCYTNDDDDNIIFEDMARLRFNE